MPTFAERLAGHLNRPVVAACGVRPPNSIAHAALAGGLGAGIGSVVGGTLFAGIGGGLGVAVGYLLLWLRIRGSGQSISMALVLEPDRLDLLRLGALGIAKPSGTIRSIPYTDVTAVHTREGFLEMRIVLRTNDEELDLRGSRRGIGAAPPVIEELRRRVTTEPDTAAR
jgi:hypothetical protein